MSENMILILLGIAGVIFHCLEKMKNLRDSALSANLTFHWYQTYVKKDMIAIALSFISVFIWYGTFGEVGKKYSVVLDFTRISFVLAGITGSYIIQLIADIAKGSAKKTIMKYVDVKTNISDIVTQTGKSATIDEVITKGSDATGEDVTKTPEPLPKSDG